MNPQDILTIISRASDAPNRQQRNTANSDDPIFSIICTIAGGFLGGPAGMAIGGLAGTALNTLLSPTPNHRPIDNRPQRSANPRTMSRSALSDIIENQMNDEQRRKLAQMVRQILRENPSNSNNGGRNVRSERNFLETENMSNTLISHVLSVAQNGGQTSGSSSSSRMYRPRLGSHRVPSSSGRSGGCGGGCGCGSRRGSSS